MCRRNFRLLEYQKNWNLEKTCIRSYFTEMNQVWIDFTSKRFILSTSYFQHIILFNSDLFENVLHNQSAYITRSNTPWELKPPYLLVEAFKSLQNLYIYMYMYMYMNVKGLFAIDLFCSLIFWLPIITEIQSSVQSKSA